MSNVPAQVSMRILPKDVLSSRVTAAQDQLTAVTPVGQSKRSFLDEVYSTYRGDTVTEIQTEDISDVESQEASLVLEIVRAQRDVSRAEKALADCIVREHEKIVELHRFKAQQSQNTANSKDLHIGGINALFSIYGRPSPIPKLRGPISPPIQRPPLRNGILTQAAAGRFLTIQLD